MNVLVVDERVRDYQVFLDSVNSNTTAILFRSTSDLKDALTIPCDRMGFVFELGTPMAQVLLESKDLLIDSGIREMDFLACDTLPAWQSFYDQLTGIRVGASNNQTGNLQYGGDWLMESTCEDVESLYFTRSIQYYKYLLGLGYHTTILDFSGNLWGCGWNEYGQLGLNNNIISVPNFSFMRSKVASFATGYYHTLALDFSGNLWGCGRNNNGQLGLNNKVASVTNFSFMRSGVTSFAAGGTHTLILDASGDLWGCGVNANRQLGLNNNGVDVTNFSFIRSKVSSIAAGGHHTLMLDASGDLWGCGANGNGQLGLNNNGVDVTTFYFMKSNISSMAAGNQQTLALDISGTLWGCGSNSNGQLAKDPGGTNVTTFYLMRTKVSSFATGGLHTLILDASGDLWGCGRNQERQLTSNNVNSVTQFYFMRSNVSSIEGGGLHTLVLDASGDLWGCGSNGNGQLAKDTGGNNVTQLSLLRSRVYCIDSNLISNIVLTTVTQIVNKNEIQCTGSNITGGTFTVKDSNGNIIPSTTTSTSFTLKRAGVTNQYTVVYNVGNRYSNKMTFTFNYVWVLLANQILTVSLPYTFPYQTPDYFGYIDDFNQVLTGPNLNTYIGTGMEVSTTDGTFRSSAMCVFGYIVPTSTSHTFTLGLADDFAACYIGNKDQSIHDFRTLISSQTVAQSSPFLYVTWDLQDTKTSTKSDFVIGGYYPILIHFINNKGGSHFIFKIDGSYLVSNLVKSSKGPESQTKLMYYALTNDKTVNAGLAESTFTTTTFSSNAITKVGDPKWAMYYDTQKMSVPYTSANRTVSNGIIVDLAITYATRINSRVTLVGTGFNTFLTIKIGSETISNYVVDENRIMFTYTGTGSSVYIMYGYTTSNATITSSTVTSIFQRGNLLNLIGTNFNYNTFFIDGKDYYPFAPYEPLTGYARTVQFDNYNLKNVDMVQSFVTKYDSSSPGSGTVAFQGVFRPSNGTWVVQLVADDQCVMTIVDQENNTLFTDTILHNSTFSGYSIPVTDSSIQMYTITLVWIQIGTGFDAYQYKNTNGIRFTLLDPYNNLIQDVSPYISFNGTPGFKYTTTETITRDLITPYTTKLKVFYYGTSTTLFGVNVTRADYAIKRGTEYFLYGTGLIGTTAVISNSQIQTLVSDQKSDDLVIDYNYNNVTRYIGPESVSVNRIVVTKNSFSVDALLYDSPTVTYSGNYCTLRNFPTSIFPPVINPLNINTNPCAYVYYGYFYAPATGTYTFDLPGIDDVGNFILGKSEYTYSHLRTGTLRDYLLTLAAYWNGGTGVYQGYTTNAVLTTNYGVSLTEGAYYPVVLSYVNMTGGSVLSCKVTYNNITRDLLSYCYSETTFENIRPQEGLYMYPFNETQLDAAMGARGGFTQNEIVAYNQEANANMYKLFTTPPGVNVGFFPRSSVYRIPSTSGTTTSWLSTPDVSKRVAHCYYGYVKTSVTGDHVFNVKDTDDLLDIRIGSSTDSILELRNNKTSSVQTITSPWHIDKTATVAFTANTYYPILITWVNTGGPGNIQFDVTPPGVARGPVINYGYTVGYTSGFTYYTLDDTLLESISLGTINYTMMVSVINRIFSPSWAFVESDQSITVMAASPANIPISGAILNTTELKITSTSYSGTTLTITGTGFHTNLKVYLNGSTTSTAYTLSGNLVLSNTINPSTIQLKDGLVSHLYNNVYVTDVQPTRLLTSAGETFTYVGNGLNTLTITFTGVTVVTGDNTKPSLTTTSDKAVLTLPYGSVRSSVLITPTFGTLTYSNSYNYNPFTLNKAYPTAARPDAVTVREGIRKDPTSYAETTSFTSVKNSPIVAEVYFGYFTPTPGTYRLTTTIDDEGQVRIGDTTLAALRNGTATIVLLTTNYETTATATYDFIAKAYPIVITSVNLGGDYSITCEVEYFNTATSIYEPKQSILNYCSSEFSGSLYRYTLNETLLRSLTLLDRVSVQSNLDKIYSPLWSYGVKYWLNTDLTLSGITFPPTTLEIKSYTFINGTLTITGTGFHDRVDVYLDGSLIPSSYDNNVITVSVGTFDRMYLKDDHVISNVIERTYLNPAYLVSSTQDAITFTGNNLTGTAVTYTKDGFTSALPSGWIYTVQNKSIILTLPFGTIRSKIKFTPIFTKSGDITYGVEVEFTSLSYVQLTVPTPVNTYLGDTLTFTGFNLLNTVANVNGYATTVTTDTIVATIPLGSVRSDATFTPTFTKNGLLLNYGNSITYKSTAYVNTDVPSVVWNSTGDTLTFTGFNLLNTEVTQIRGWSYVAMSDKIVVTVPQGIARPTDNIIVTPHFSKVGLLDYGKAVPVISSVYVLSEYPTKTISTTGEIYTFNGSTRVNTVVTNISTFTYSQTGSSIAVKVPLGTVRSAYTLKPTFTDGGTLDYPISVNFQSDTYVDPVIPSVVWSNGDKLTFTGVNLLNTEVTNIQGWSYVTGYSQIIVTVPPGSVRPSDNLMLTPTFSKVGLLDYGKTVPVLSSAYLLNQAPTKTITPLGEVYTFDGSNLLNTVVSNITGNYATSQSSITVTVPLGSERSPKSLKPVFNYGGVLDYTQTVNFQSSAYVDTTIPSVVWNATGDTLTFTGFNLLNTEVTDIRGWSYVATSDKIVVTVPQGIARPADNVTLRPNFSKVGLLDYGKTVPVLSSTYVLNDYPTKTIGATEIYTFNGFNLKDTVVSNIIGTYSTTDTAITVTVPLGSARSAYFLQPNFSYGGTLEYTRSVNFQSGRYINTDIPKVVWSSTGDTLTFTGADLLNTEVTNIQGWSYVTSYGQIVVTVPPGSVRLSDALTVTPNFSKVGPLDYGKTVPVLSSAYLLNVAPTKTTTSLGEVYTFNGSNLINTAVSNIVGEYTKTQSTVTITVPLGTERSTKSLKPVFNYGGDLEYTQTIDFQSSAYVDTTIPSVVWSETGDTLTFTGFNLSNTEVTQIRGWSYVAMSDKIVVTVPQGTVRLSDAIKVTPYFSKVGPLDYGKTVPVLSSAYVLNQAPTKTLSSTGEIYTFNGSNLASVYVSNIRGTYSTTESEIKVTVPLGSIRTASLLKPNFSYGVPLDYSLSVDYQSDFYVKNVAPQTLVTSEGEQLIFSGKNLTGATATVQSFPIVVNATEIIATIPLGSIRTETAFTPTFTKEGPLDYTFPVTFTSNTYVNRTPTQDISSNGFLLQYSGVNLANTTVSLSANLTWPTFVSDTKIILAVPFYTETTAFTPTFTKVGNLDYGIEDTFTPYITSVTRRNNILVVQGNGFNQNTSFLLEGVYDRTLHID